MKMSSICKLAYDIFYHFLFCPLFLYNGSEFRKCLVASLTSCLSFSFVNSRQTVTRNFFNFDPKTENDKLITI